MIQIAEPAIFKPYKRIKAYFSYRNSDEVNKDGVIPGLNTGMNTEAPMDEVGKNKQAYLNAVKLNPDDLTIAKQVHSNHVEIVNQPGIKDDTDALVTNQHGLVLGIQVADCAAILLADPDHEVIGAVHAGWRGAVAGILPDALEMMEKKGADPSRILAWVSPCISIHRFEVGEEVASQFPDQFVDYNSYSKPHVDLSAYIQDQLVNYGVLSSQIEVDNRCTFDGVNEFYSFRRERERAGRMLALITINP
jgi:YfiH family protein